ncbi:MAG: type II toxin-antitoxin system HicA family toxin [Chloroflexi bacterium]|nr:MAG: type II toxin-antitoxin system HicA family toxin [Chloroflexota bacterium]HEY68227.1 type II toxin-antitoxin system HicA family toxin [Thermoflexia bacterium]
MSKLSPVKWSELVRRLRALGFEGPFAGGKHPYMVRDDLVLRIPNPHRREIGPDLLARILRQAKVSRREWERAK